MIVVDASALLKALYVALAKALDAPLITRDRRLGAPSGHRAQIELV